MSFIGKYLIEPFKYVTSDKLKALIGISLLFFNAVIDLVLSTVLGPFSSIIVFLIDVIIGIILSGYYMGVIKNTLKGIDALPNWSNFTEIIIDGILYNIGTFILTIIAYLPAILLLIVGVFFTAVEFGGYLISSFGSYSTYSDPWSIITSLSIIIVLLLIYLIIASIAFLIYDPLATVNFAKKGFFGFFEFFYILKKVSLEYIGILLLYIGLGIILGIIIVVIAYISLAIFFLIPPVGMLVLLFTFLIISTTVFILVVMFYRAIAKYYLRSEQ